MIRKPSGYAIVYVFLLLAMVLVPALAHIRRAQREAAMPHTLEEAAERIREARPDWRVVGNRRDGNVCNGFFVLRRADAEIAGGVPFVNAPDWQWHGVVLVIKKPSPPDVIFDSDNPALWTEIGEFLTHGDATIISDVRSILRRQ